MQEPTFLILTALAAEPLHGYAVIGKVADLSDGRVTLRAGTLYTALDRLTAEGLIDVVREEVVDGRHRRYYALTPPGSSRLTEEAARLRSNATHALRQLRLGGLGA